MAQTDVLGFNRIILWTWVD